MNRPLTLFFSYTTNIQTIRHYSFHVPLSSFTNCSSPSKKSNNNLETNEFKKCRSIFTFSNCTSNHMEFHYKHCNKHSACFNSPAEKLYKLAHWVHQPNLHYCMSNQTYYNMLPLIKPKQLKTTMTFPN